MTASKVQSLVQRPMSLSRRPVEQAAAMVGMAEMPPTRRSIPAKTSRNLFGTPDPEELKAICERGMQRESDRMLSKYGFDMKTEKFVGENFIDVTHIATAVTTSSEESNIDARDATPEAKTSASSSSNSFKSNSIVINSIKTLSPRKPYERLKAGRQTALTEFWPTRKPTTSESSTSKKIEDSTTTTTTTAATITTTTPSSSAQSKQ